MAVFKERYSSTTAIVERLFFPTLNIDWSFVAYRSDRYFGFCLLDLLIQSAKSVCYFGLPNRSAISVRRVQFRPLMHPVLAVC